MSKYAMNFYTRCTDPAREKEFNSWYSHTHLPALRLAKGLTSARRYICTDISCEAKYLAVYEFETEDIQESLRSFSRLFGSLLKPAIISIALNQYPLLIRRRLPASKSFWRRR